MYYPIVVAVLTLLNQGNLIHVTVLSRLSAGGTEENHKNLNQDSRLRGRKSNPRPPEYEVGVLTLDHDVRCPLEGRCWSSGEGKLFV
jgi:hypothetical protein